MEAKVKEVLEKVKITACAAGRAAESAANAATKKAGEALETTKLTLINFDLNTDIEMLYREIGRLVYLTHEGEDIDPECITARIALIDEKFAKIEANKKQIAYRKLFTECPECGKDCKKEDAFCSACGYKF
ncbi:MAG: zinc ribbon domain-containing protein [Clostridia bacterium]|nr:zinc ribbon domain-containing protein [Clostridia bacterium]